MKLTYKTITSIFCVFALQSCVKEIKLVSNYESSIFIYGNLTNETDYVNVLVLKTTPVTDNSQAYITDAKISLYTENNNVPTLITKNFTLTPEKNYKSSEKIASIIGNNYWIEVALQDGTTFKSVKEKLLPPVAISELAYKKGQVKVYFEDPKNSTNFYHLEVASIDNVKNSFLSYFKIENDILYNGNKKAFIESNYFSGSYFVIKLSNINFETYRFFLNLYKQNEKKKNTIDNEELGNPSQLFASPPVNLIGNIQNKKTNEKALGNFGVFSKSISKRYKLPSIFQTNKNNMEKHQR